MGTNEMCIKLALWAWITSTFLMSATGLVRATSPTINACSRCQKYESCSPPNCFCCRDQLDVPFSNQEIPQIVFFTFDDAVNSQIAKYYRQLFDSSRQNPNGCPISMTLFISHANTNYSLVTELYTKGMEIASHSVTHSHLNTETFYKEAKDQRNNLATLAGIPHNKIVGWRSPYLESVGDAQPSELRQLGYQYDATLTYSKRILKAKAPVPFTLDYGWPYDCKIKPCPLGSHRGFWEVPVVSVLDYQQKYECVYVDGCLNPPPDERSAFQFLWDNFQSYYHNGRTPFGINMHPAWFYNSDRLQAMDRFIKELVKLNDVYIVSVDKMIEWLKHPTPLSRINSFWPWACGATRSKNDNHFGQQGRSSQTHGPRSERNRWDHNFQSQQWRPPLVVARSQTQAPERHWLSGPDRVAFRRTWEEDMRPQNQARPPTPPAPPLFQTSDTRLPPRVFAQAAPPPPPPPPPPALHFQFESAGTQLASDRMAQQSIFEQRLSEDSFLPHSRLSQTNNGWTSPVEYPHPWAANGRPRQSEQQQGVSVLQHQAELPATRLAHPRGESFPSNAPTIPLLGVVSEVVQPVRPQIRHPPVPVIETTQQSKQVIQNGMLQESRPRHAPLATVVRQISHSLSSLSQPVIDEPSTRKPMHHPWLLDNAPPPLDARVSLTPPTPHSVSPPLSLVAHTSLLQKPVDSTVKQLPWRTSIPPSSSQWKRLSGASFAAKIPLQQNVAALKTEQRQIPPFKVGRQPTPWRLTVPHSIIAPSTLSQSKPSTDTKSKQSVPSENQMNPKEWRIGGDIAKIVKSDAKLWQQSIPSSHGVPISQSQSRNQHQRLRELLFARKKVYIKPTNIFASGQHSVSAQDKNNQVLEQTTAIRNNPQVDVGNTSQIIQPPLVPAELRQWVKI